MITAVLHKLFSVDAASIVRKAIKRRNSIEFQ